jgi:hypothetical protein
MAGVLIYKSAVQYYSLISTDDKIYDTIKTGITARGDQILWEREHVSLRQIENARKTKDAVVSKLNKGNTINLESELSTFFQ